MIYPPKRGSRIRVLLSFFSENYQRRPVARPETPPRRILLIRPSALGDVCRTVPLIASLKSAWPDSGIDWIVQEEFLPAVRTHPAVETFIAFPRQRFARWYRNAAVFAEFRHWMRRLREREYDLVIDAQGLGRSGFMAWRTRAPIRIGPREAREFGWLGYTVRHQAPPADDAMPVHTVDRMLMLLEPLGIPIVRDMRLYVEPAARDWWTEFRRQLGPLDEPYAVIAPTSRWPSKRWPIERWGELIKPLLQRGFGRIMLIGAPGEIDQVKPILPDRDHPEMPLINLIGRAGLAQTLAVIANADLVIANDSAPLHMAVGFDRPCLGLFGPTDPRTVGPYDRPLSSLRGFAPKPGEIVHYRDPKIGDRLMRVISTSAVLQRVDQVLAQHEEQAASHRTVAAGGRLSGEESTG